MRLRLRFLTVCLIALLLVPLLPPLGVVYAGTEGPISSTGTVTVAGPWSSTGANNARVYDGASSTSYAVTSGDRIQSAGAITVLTFAGTNTGKRINSVQLRWNYRWADTGRGIGYGNGNYAFQYTVNNWTTTTTAVTYTSAQPAVFTVYTTAALTTNPSGGSWTWADIANLRMRTNFASSPSYDGTLRIDAMDIVSIDYDSTAPPVPTGVNVTDPITDGDLNIAWTGVTDPGDLGGYRVWRWNGSSYVDVSGLLSTATTSWADSGLTNGQSYTYVVTSEDNNTSPNVSANSSSAAATPTAPVPPTLTITNPTTGRQLNASWTADGSADGYNLYRSTIITGPWNASTKLNTSGLIAGTSYNDTAVSDGTTYYYVVRSHFPAGHESGDSSVMSGVSTDVIAPGTPANLAVVNPGTGDRLNLSWDAVTDPGDLAGYKVFRRVSAGSYNYASPYATVASGVVTYADTSATDGTTFYYVVRAYDNTGNMSSDSNESSGTSTAPDTTPPSQPTGLTVTNPGTGRNLAISWSPNGETDLAGYNLYRDGSGTPLNGTLIVTTSYTDFGLTDGVSYSYVVKAQDLSSNVSPASSTVAGTPTDVTAPNAVAGVGVANGSDGTSLVLTWSANAASDLSSYRIYRRTDSGPFTESDFDGSVSTPTLTYTSTGLTMNTTYYFIVKAADTTGNKSTDSSVVSRAPQETTPPTVPTLSVAVPGVNYQLNLTWTVSTDASSGLQGYRVYRATTSGGSFSRVTAGTVDVTQPTVAYNDTGLLGETTYYYKVTAVDNAGNESAYSNESSGTPTNPPPPPEPSLTELAQGPYRQPFRIWSQVGRTTCDTAGVLCQYSMEWAPVAGALSYIVQYSDVSNIMVYTDTGWNWDDGGTWTVASAGTSFTTIDVELTPYRNYVLRVKAMDGAAGTGSVVSISGASQVTYFRIYPPDTIPHGGFTADTNLCLNCHQTHSGESPRMARANSANALCLTCHNGQGSKYDVLDGQTRGSDGLTTTSDGSPENSAGAFGSVEEQWDATTTTHTLITSQHSVGENVSAAPGSGGSYGGTLMCISCHNPHGTANYRILKTRINRFNVAVPALASTNAGSTGAETTQYFGGYNATHSGNVVTSTTGTQTTDATITLAGGASSTSETYTNSFITVTKSTSTYGGYITGYVGATRVATVRVIGGSDDWPVMDSTYAYTIGTNNYAQTGLMGDPRASIITLCQACHTSFALSRSGTAKTGVTNDGGALGADTHRYRHAMGIRVYQGRRADDTPFGYPGYAIKATATHPYDYSLTNGGVYPWVVVLENQDRSDGGWTETSSTSNRNRIVCISCHVAHGTDRFGFSPVTNTTVSATSETVEVGTGTAVSGTTFQLQASAAAGFPLSPRGLLITVGSETKKIISFDETTRTVTLESAWTPTNGSYAYAVKRHIDSLNPTDTSTDIQTSTVLKRRNNMGVCQACHQK